MATHLTLTSFHGMAVRQVHNMASQSKTSCGHIIVPVRNGHHSWHGICALALSAMLKNDGRKRPYSACWRPVPAYP